jgi:predicted membrane chloride channel (bestrophin family)
MILKKFTAIYLAFKNTDAYEDLLHAKEKLGQVNEQIRNLDKLYLENQKKATLAALSPSEISKIRNEKIENAVAYWLDSFNKQFVKEVKQGNEKFVFTIEDPQQKDIAALKFISNKLQEEGLGIKLSDVKLLGGGVTNSWTEINMSVKLRQHELNIESFQIKPKFRTN